MLNARALVASAWLLVALLSTGCSRLPLLNPDLARPSAAAVRVEGARGVLSAAQSKVILDRLRSNSPNTNIFDRHLALEEAIVGSPLTTGNAVKLLEDGPATYRAMLAAIEAAKDHINLETYILEDDEVGHSFAQALIARQRQGVQVNVIRDSVGTLGTPNAFFKTLSDSGVNMLEFNPVNPLLARKAWKLNQRDHRKLLIVDGTVAFLGGTNISSVHSGGSFSQRSRAQRKLTEKLPEEPLNAEPGKSLAWRDTDLQLQGPVVAEFQRLFLDTWEKQHGAALAQRNYFPPLKNMGTQVVRAIGSSPGDPFSLIYATLLSAIGSAEASVYLTNAYFVPDPQLLATLKAAAARGVDVRLILPSQTDWWLVFHAGRGHYAQLLRAGVKIYERRGAILHSKTALIDGVWATVGSTNLDWRSFLHNDELNAVVLGTEFGSQLKAMFNKDLAASDQITLEKWQQRPFNLRIKEMFGKLWEYWL